MASLMNGDVDDDTSSSSWCGSAFEVVSDPEAKVETFSWETKGGASDDSFLSSSSSSSGDTVLIEGTPPEEETKQKPPAAVMAVASSGSADDSDESAQSSFELLSTNSAPTTEYEYESDFLQSEEESLSSYTVCTSVNRRMGRLQLQPPESPLLVSKMKDLNMTKPDKTECDDDSRLSPSVKRGGPVFRLPDDDKHTYQPIKRARNITDAEVGPSILRRMPFPTKDIDDTAAATDVASDGTNGAAMPEAAGAENQSAVPGDSPIARTWELTTALCISFQPPLYLMFNGSFTSALKHAREQKKLLLVSIQDYGKFSSHLINRDILGDSLVRNLIESEYVFWQTTTDDQEGKEYVNRYLVGSAPHLGVIHPTLGGVVWGADEWMDDKPWSVSNVAHSLTEICFDRFHGEKRSMEIGFEADHNGGSGPVGDIIQDKSMVDASEEYAVQAALNVASASWGYGHPSEEVVYLLELQCALLQSQSMTCKEESPSSYTISTSGRCQLQPPESPLLVSKIKNLNMTKPDKTESDDDSISIPSLKSDSLVFELQDNDKHTFQSITCVPNITEAAGGPSIRRQMPFPTQDIDDTTAAMDANSDAMNGTAMLEAAGAEQQSQVLYDPSIARTCGFNDERDQNALCILFQPPLYLKFNGSFTSALKHAREQKKLLLVNIQDYGQFSNHLVNRDIFGDGLVRNLIELEYVFWQTTTDDQEGKDYINRYNVGLAPHLGVIHPTHGSVIWGIDGWMDDKPWSVSNVAQSLTEICFDRFHKEQRSMEIDFDAAHKSRKPVHSEKIIYP
jgi:hypothetical protein